MVGDQSQVTGRIAYILEVCKNPARNPQVPHSASYRWRDAIPFGTPLQTPQGVLCRCAT